MSDKYPNSGALYVNDRKQTDKHKDYWGSITIQTSLLLELMQKQTDSDSVTIKLAAWIRHGAKGDFIGLNVDTWEPPNKVQTQAPASQPAALPTPPADDSDIPF